MECEPIKGDSEKKKTIWELFDELDKIHKSEKVTSGFFYTTYTISRDGKKY